MNRQKRLSQKAVSPNADHFLNKGHLALQQKNFSLALLNYIEAVELRKNNPTYKLYLFNLLKKLSFSQFNQRIQNAILLLLKTPGLDYQSLWSPWFSILMNDPEMKELHLLIAKKEIDLKKLQTCLVQPYFLAGLHNLICFDPDFEQALSQISRDMDDGAHYPKAFRVAFEAYCKHTEYVFCKDSEKQKTYEVDPTIEILSMPKGKVSGNVQAQYEANPYPRWTSCTTIGFSKTREAPQPYDHLIAGCGTGYGTCLTALKHPEARITAFDLSLASLSYAKRKAAELKLKNITFYQADILDLSSLTPTYDIIECSGVLHHMEVPEDGWKSLLQKLKPNGKMNIGLYSELGRKDVVAAREFIKEQGFDVTHEGIQAARQEIMGLPDNHPARGVISRRDFYSVSSCRDLLFHVMEHRYTIPKLQNTLKNLGLIFGGFSLENTNILKEYQQSFPDDKDAQNLENWKVFEEEYPDTFRGMYQFWCHQKA